ncbi:MAG TPA: HAD family hydrolase [Longimicrobiales bacterium]|nr:HAD family hydrolase [Longimicrobiales bacterium]
MNGAAGRPAAFLDRDGTIIHERAYLADPEGVELLPGAAEGLRMLRDEGYVLVTVSNQSGIARGLYDEAAYGEVQARFLALLAAEGVEVAASYHCPHHPDFTGPCPCRKPATALFRDAIRDHGLDPVRSVFIGDRPGDVAPARELGGRAFMVRTGYGAMEARKAGPDVVVCDDLAAVARAAGPPRPQR